MRNVVNTLPARGVLFDSSYSLYRCILSQPQLAPAELPLLVELGDSGQKIQYHIVIVVPLPHKANIRGRGKTVHVVSNICPEVVEWWERAE